MNCSGLRRSLAPASVASATALTLWYYDQNLKGTARHHLSQCDSAASPSTSTSSDHPKLVFLGSGNSMGCPVGICSMNMNKNMKHSDSRLAPLCKISTMASHGDPRHNKNYRNNPSFLIHHYQQETGTYKNIIIDVGKTFREGALRWFPTLGIESLDAIVLTHEHMDAVAGLDDIRGFQQYHPDYRRGQRPRRVPVPVHLSQHCHDKLSNQFPFLFPKQKPTDSDSHNNNNNNNSNNNNSNSNINSNSAPMVTTSPDGKPVVHRDVAGFDVQIFQDFQPITVEGVDIVPLPVWHGDDLISYGFAFTVRSKSGTPTNVVYLSDISRMVPETMQYIQDNLPPTDVLVVDSLLWHKSHPTHFSLDQAVELRKELKPRKATYLVGMSCESFPPHDEMATHLKKEYGDVIMAYDGLVIDVLDDE